MLRRCINISLAVVAGIAMHFIAPGSASWAAPTYPYVVTNLGPLGETNKAYAINDAGQVGGQIYTSTVDPVAYEAMYWDKLKHVIVLYC